MDEREWVRIYTSNKAHHVAIIKSVLKDSGISAYEIDKRDSSYIFGDIELYVDVKDVPLSTIIIEHHQL